MRRSLWRSSRRKGGQAPGSEKSVKQAEFETLVTSKEEIGADHAGWRLLRSLPTRRPVEGYLDRVGGTGRSRSSAEGGDRPGGLHPVRVILSRLRGRAGDRSDPAPRSPEKPPGCRPSRTEAKGSSSNSAARRSTPGLGSPQSSGVAVSLRPASNAGKKTTRATASLSAFPSSCFIRCRTS